MTKDEALRMAIETLSWYDDRKYVFEAIQACKEALAEQPTQEPVAWMNDIAFSMDKDELTTEKFGDIIPLYTHPSKQWQGLSDYEIIPMYNEPSSDAEMIEFARAIEAKLREKNNGA